jgi:hypothetical protein
MPTQYIWYIEPLDKETNETIAQALQEVSDSRETMLIGVRDNTGISHNLWRCPMDLLLLLQRSKNQMNLRFEVFGQQGKGQIRKKTFLFKRPIKRMRRRPRNRKKEKV